MEIKINDTISDLMLKANDNQIFDKKMLKAYLIEGINKELEFKTPIIKDLFIENYVVQ
jgi:flagellar basal body-associated protein FliL